MTSPVAADASPTKGLQGPIAVSSIAMKEDHVA